MKKAEPHKDYPPEEGRYLRGNDFSPVAVVIILNKDEDKIPKEIEFIDELPRNAMGKVIRKELRGE